MHTKDTQDILEAISVLAETVQDISNKQDQMQVEIVGIKGEIGGIKGDIRSINSRMVTKYDLDDRLDNFRGDLVSFIRAEDSKILAKLK